MTLDQVLITYSIYSNTGSTTTPRCPKAKEICARRTRYQITQAHCPERTSHS